MVSPVMSLAPSSAKKATALPTSSRVIRLRVGALPCAFASSLNSGIPLHGRVIEVDRDGSAPKTPLPGGPATIDRKVGTGDLGGIVATQEQRQCCDLLGSNEFLGRLGFQEHIVNDLLLSEIARLHGVRNLLFDERRPDVAGADAVASDLEGRKLERHGLAEAGNAMFGRHIGRLER